MCTIARKLVPMLLAVMRTQDAFDVARWTVNRRQRAGSGRQLAPPGSAAS